MLCLHSLSRATPWIAALALGLAFGASEAEANQEAVNNPRPNVLLIAVDDLRCDLGCYGVPYAKSPHIDRLADSARVFTRHFVQVPTCGASRCALLRGRYPTVPAHVGNNAIRETQESWAADSLPTTFRRNGYTTLALGKISHYPGGLTGKHWAEGREELPGAWDRCWIPESPWKTPEAMMHGYAHGVARKPGISPPWEGVEGPDDAYPDAWVASEASRTLESLAGQTQPWFFAVGFFKPHLPFAAPKQWHDLHSTGIPDLSPEVAAKPLWPSGWHASGEFRRNYGHLGGRDPADDREYARLLRSAYAGCVSYMDAQVGRVLNTLDEQGLAMNTIVVLWSDHGFLLGEHAIWGKHCLYEGALRSPLIVRYPGLPMPGSPCEAIVESVDIFPTLIDLCGISGPEKLDGDSLRPQLQDPATPSRKPALSFWTGGQRTVRTNRWRLIAGPKSKGGEQHFELFDETSDPGEIHNVAEAHPEIVNELGMHLIRHE